MRVVSIIKLIRLSITNITKFKHTSCHLFAMIQVVIHRPLTFIKQSESICLDLEHELIIDNIIKTCYNIRLVTRYTLIYN
jgi:hypothetical protein